MAYKDVLDKFNSSGVSQPQIAPEDEYRSHLTSVFGEDATNQFYKPDPSAPIYSQIYKENIQQPKQVSEKAIKAARTASSLGDTLGVLAETFGASKGAHVTPRDFSTSATAKQSNSEKNVRNLYEQQLAAYNSGLANAAGADAQLEAASKREKNNQMLSSLQLLRKEKAEKAEKDRLQKIWEYEQGFKEATTKAEQEARDRAFNETVRNNKVQNSISQYNAKTGRISAERPRASNSYSMSWGYGTSKDGKPTRVLQVPAKQGEKDITTLPTGEVVHQIHVKEGDIPYYANQGKLALKNDPAFKARFGAAIENSVTSNSSEAESLTGETSSTKQKREADEVIAAYYAQYRYESDGQQQQQQQQQGNEFTPGGKYSVIPVAGGNVR